MLAKDLSELHGHVVQAGPPTWLLEDVTLVSRPLVTRADATAGLSRILVRPMATFDTVPEEHGDVKLMLGLQ